MIHSTSKSMEALCRTILSIQYCSSTKVLALPCATTSLPTVLASSKNDLRNGDRKQSSKLINICRKMRKIVIDLSIYLQSNMLIISTAIFSYEWVRINICTWRCRLTSNWKNLLIIDFKGQRISQWWAITVSCQVLRGGN